MTRTDRASPGVTVSVHAFQTRITSPERLRCTLCLVVFCLLGSACGLHDQEERVDRDAIFVEDRVVQWVISVGDEDWRKLLLEQAEYVPAEVEVDGVLYENVGLRMVGNKNRAKFSMRIRFNRFDPVLRFHGVKRINLFNNAGDPSLVREALALELMRNAGVPAPRSSLVWVEMGDGGGVYTLVEQVDNRFLEDRFAEDSGELYKLERGANLVYRGDELESYDWLNSYELKADAENVQGTALVGLMKTLDLSSTEELRRALPRVLDVDGFLLLLAVNSWLANMDSYAGTGGNLYLYRDSRGRFRGVACILNLAHGNYHGRHCKLGEDEERCRQTSTAFCESACQRTGAECPEYCVEYYAELCVEHHSEFCRYTSRDDAEEEACRENAPEYCGYTTDEMLALHPDVPTCSTSRPLVERVLAVPAFKQLYHDRLQQLIDGVLEPGSVEARAERMRMLVSDQAAMDVGRDCYDCARDFEASFTTDLLLDVEDRWEERVPGLLPFARARDEVIREALRGNRE